jgi:hypothetical protein
MIMKSQLWLTILTVGFLFWGCGTSQPQFAVYQHLTEPFLSTIDTLVFLERPSDGLRGSYRVCIQGNGTVLFEGLEPPIDSLVHDEITREQFQQLLAHFDAANFFYSLEQELNGPVVFNHVPRVTVMARVGSRQKRISCGGECVGSDGAKRFSWLANQIDSVAQTKRWSVPILYLRGGTVRY